MLLDMEQFEMVEKALMEQGFIQEFERECGKIKGHIMITRTDIPEDLRIQPERARYVHAFACSFDFYDVVLGIALYLDTLEAASDLWMIPQTEKAIEPSEEWIQFFISKLIESIDENGSFGYPVYSFVNDNSDFTLVPTMPEEDVSCGT